jgi:putative MATE family efflux protein
MTTNRIDLLEDPVGPTLLRLAGPMSLGFLAVILFSVVDTFWVGRLGARELAAMSFTFPVVFLIMSISIGIGVGVTAVVSRAIGAGDTHRVCRFTTDGLLLANILVVMVAIAGLVTIGPVFGALGASPDMIALVGRYMVPWYIGVGFIVIPIVGNAAIRATGDTKTPSLIMIIAGGVNMILDPFLIFGPGPFPRLELQGAAIATVIAYTITFFAAFAILWKRERMLEFSRPSLAEVIESWRRILYVGVPAAATQMLVPLATGILTRIVAAFGPEAVAAFGVGTRIESLSMIGPTALAASVTPFVGQNLGARNCVRVRAGVRFGVLVSLVYGAAAAGVLALLARPLASIFTGEGAVIDIISWYLYIVPVSYGLFGAMFAVNATFNAADHPLRAALVIVVRLFVLAVPLALAGSVLGDLPGLFAGISAANMIVGVLAILMTRHFLRRVEERIVSVGGGASSGES